MSLIKVNGLSAGYGKKNVIENISFEINPGEMVGVLGLNGSGKSTLAKAICGIIPHQGEVIIDETSTTNLSVSQIAKRISYVPQVSGIGIDISVFDVVMMGFNSRLGLFQNPTEDMKEKVISVIRRVGLNDLIDANYLMLSEGQKRLVILARALVSDGSFIVMDEPEGALDFSVRYKMMSCVRDWICGEKRAGLVILHDTTLALNSCDKLILIRDKKIVGLCDLKSDNIDAIEQQLRMIYGNVSLMRVQGKTSGDYVMVYESEDV